MLLMFAEAAAQAVGGGLVCGCSLPLTNRSTHPKPPKPPKQAHPNSIALYVPCEVSTFCYYPGSNKDYLVSNVIFRSGSAGVIMTNKPSLIPRCKYELHSSTRVHMGRDDTSYK